MNYKYLFFDLDGTLTASDEGITNSVKYALESIGVVENDMQKLLKFVGPPLYDGFNSYGNYDDEIIAGLIAKYRERFVVKGIYENRLYDGIMDLLKCLKLSGKKIIMATSKPEKFSMVIADYFNITEYFDIICGSTLDGKVSTKEQVLQLSIERCNIKDKSEAVMIGDRFYDVQGANHNGIDCIGVSYGYGTKEELLESGAVCVAESVQELKTILLQK